jgi:hypothetical protein
VSVLAERDRSKSYYYYSKSSYNIAHVDVLAYKMVVEILKKKKKKHWLNISREEEHHEIN